MFNWKIFYSVVNLVTLDQFRKEKSSTLSSFLVHPFPTVRVLFIYFGFHFEKLFGAQIRADTAEYLYVFLQSKDIGFETDEIEEIILDTEWYVSFFFHFPSLWSKTILTLNSKVCKRYGYGARGCQQYRPPFRLFRELKYIIYQYCKIWMYL